MIKKIGLVVLIAVLGFIGYDLYGSYRKGYFGIPDLPDGAYVFSYGDGPRGLKGIVLDADVSDPLKGYPQYLRRIHYANRDRRYFAIPMEVPSWFENAWSTCTRARDVEKRRYLAELPTDLSRDLSTARFDAVCRIKADGKEIVRGFLFSVPKL